MKVVITCAGMGKRLLPLTKDKPKCLVKVYGKPIVQHTIDNLIEIGIQSIILIIGYKGNQSATNTHSKIMTQLIKTKDVTAFHDFKAFLDFEGYRNVDGFQYLLLTMFDGSQASSKVNLKNSFLVIDFKTTPAQKIYDIFRKYIKPTGKAEWHTNGTGIVGTFKKQN